MPKFRLNIRMIENGAGRVPPANPTIWVVYEMEAPDAIKAADIVGPDYEDMEVDLYDTLIALENAGYMVEDAHAERILP
jgi:hypothetical protein